MAVYWTMFALPAFFALIEPAVRRVQASNLPLLGIIGTLWFFMAFRETGGDYPMYLDMFRNIHGTDLFEALKSSDMNDPGYMFLNWLSDILGLQLYGVNAACAALFLFGLYVFVQDEQKPYLAVAIAVTYLVVVVAIGYTRQGTAIGLLMVAIGYIRRYQPIKAFCWILGASLMHSTAALFFPLVYFAVRIENPSILWCVRVVVIGAALWAIWSILSDKSDAFYSNYVETNHYDSDGAFVRSLMSGLAAVIFLIFLGKWRKSYDDTRIWLVYALAALAAVPGSLIASTAVDRMGLYLLPLQIVVFGRLPQLAADYLGNRTVVLAIVACYTLTLIVWLHFGQFAAVLWLPYKSLILGTVA